MKIYSAVLAAAFFLAGMATMKVLGPTGAVKLIAAPAVAATPSGSGAMRPSNIQAMCMTGFGANPGYYSATAADVKYQCTSGPLTCSGKFDAIEGTVLSGPVRFQYACISKSP